jgi:hypothetical protein
MTGPSGAGLRESAAADGGPQLPARNACGPADDALLFAFVKGFEGLISAIFRGFTGFLDRFHASHMP